MKYIIVLLLLVPFVLGATTIDSQGSGIVRGSFEHKVTIDPAASNEVTADDVRPNDLITIVFGKTKYGLEDKVSYFWKTYSTSTGWRYEIMKGERNLAVKEGETIELDYNSDGFQDVFITFEAWDGRQGIFTIATAQTITEPAVEPEELEPETEDVEVEEPVEQGQDDLGLEEVEEEVVPELPVPETTPPSRVVQEESTLPLVILVVVLFAAVGGALAYTFLTGNEPKKGKKVKK